MSKKWLRVTNAVFLAAVLGLSLLVDGNGRVMGLSEVHSTILAIAVFAGAFSAAGLLIATSRGWQRGTGIVLAIIYVGMLLPAVLP